MDGPPRVFVSHTTQDHRDLALAHALYEGLTSRGADVWIAPEKIPSGAKWEQEIVANLQQATHLIVIVSAASIGSVWVQKEIELARARYEEGSQIRILPLVVGRVDSFPNQEFLSQFQQLNYSDDVRTQVDQVASALGLPSINWTHYGRQILAELETGSSLPHQANVALDELIPVRLSRLREAHNTNNPIEVLGLTSLLEESSPVVLVGPGGSGKTTALQWLAFIAAKRALEAQSVEEFAVAPVLIELSKYKDDLINLIQRALTTRGVKVDEPDLRSELKKGRILLLLDGFDEVGNRKRLLADIDELLTIDRRVVVTSRPITALNAGALLRFKRFDIEPLDDSQIRELLALRLGQTRAGALLQLLEERKVVEAFRQPLMAWFLSIAYQDPEVPNVLLPKGALYDKVTNYFLEQWEAKRYERLVSHDTAMKVRVLNRLGHEMVLRKATLLAEDEFREICRAETNPQGLSLSEQVHLLEDLFSTGLIKRSSEGATFAHLTLRDFFAAKWLKDHFNLRQLLKLSVQSDWYEPLVHLTGLLPVSEARNWLNWMIRMASLTTSFEQISSSRWTANQILLTLNCLGNTSESHDDLKDRFLTLLKNRKPFLAQTTVSIDLTFPFGIDYVYAYFCALVGRLRRPLSLEVLNNVKSQQSRMCGLCQLWDLERLLKEFEWPEHRDGIADLLAAYFIFKFPVDTVVPAIERFIDEHDSHQNARLLEALNSCLHSGDEARNGSYSAFGQEDSGLIQLMTRIALHAEDESSRHSALSIIRSFGDRSSLPKLSESAMMDAIRGQSDQDVQVRAIWDLVYGKTDASLNLLRELLDNESRDLALTALDALRIRDRNRFGTHVAHVLKRVFGVQFDDSEFFDRARDFAENASAKPARSKDTETVAYLVAGALLPSWELYRRFSVEALFITKQRGLAPLFEQVLAEDENERVRERALAGLTQVLEADAEPYILGALDDPSPLVRGEAVDDIQFRFPQQLLAKAIPKLEQMATDDPDAEVKKRARWAVEKSKRQPDL